MQTVIVTDAKYRAAIAAVRMLHRAGCRVVAVQTRADCDGTPPAFFSRCVAESRWLEGSSRDAAFPARLAALLRDYDHPVLLCVWGVTLDAVSAHQAELARYCDFLIAPPEILRCVNDKEQVRRMAVRMGIPTPAAYSAEDVQYPAIVKPHCGEKFGLKAGDRYTVVHSDEELRRAEARLAAYESEPPLVQEYVTGDGIGVSILMGKDGKKHSALCHRRIREYPVTGGPSSCCESFYDEARIDAAERLLAAFGFYGLAMVEFKGDRLLEINPRIWGSFPLADKAESSFLANYVRLCRGEAAPYQAKDYRTDVRMYFLLNDTLAALQYVRHGQLRRALGYVSDLFRAKEALRDREDPAPFRQYLKQTLRRK